MRARNRPTSNPLLDKRFQVHGERCTVPYLWVLQFRKQVLKNHPGCNMTHLAQHGLSWTELRAVMEGRAYAFENLEWCERAMTDVLRAVERWCCEQVRVSE